MSEFVLEEFLPYQLAVLSNRLSGGFSDNYKKFGLSIPDWRVIAHLSQAKKVSIREIYKQVEMDKSKASRAAARLKKAGYVTKKINPSDRRLVELSLTRKGREMMEEIGPLAFDFEETALDHLSETDRALFLATVKSILEKFQ